MRPVPKRLRHHRILELVAREPLATQDELVRRLAREGLHITQATLSRDIKELGLVKTAEGYAAPSDMAGESAAPLPSLAHLLREFVVEVRQAQNLLVIKTSAGSAQPVAAALDGEGWPEVVGTLAGDDTILVVASDKKTAAGLAAKIRGMLR